MSDLIWTQNMDILSSHSEPTVSTHTLCNTCAIIYSREVRVILMQQHDLAPLH